MADYADHDVVVFLQFGWPINYTSSVLPQPTHTNHHSAPAYPEDVQHYLSTELSFGALAGAHELIISPLQTDVVLLSAVSVNSVFSKTHYLDKESQLRLPGIDRLREYIISKVSGCFVYKKDLKRAYWQFPIDPKDYTYLGFMWDGLFYFDTRCPFGLRSSALVCQRTIHVFTKEGYTADVYLDEFLRR